MTQHPTPISCDLSSFAVEMIVPITVQVWANDAEEAKTIALGLLKLALDASDDPICIGFPRIVVKELK